MSEFFRCAVCGRMLLPGVEEQRTVCALCAREGGAIEMPPPRRRPTPCTRCNHMHLVRVIPRGLARDTVGPMFATYQFPIQPSEGFGVFEAYICKKCGFVEWYCHAPEEIPIGPEYMTEEIDLEGDAPYR